jgi:hypothetical protein
MMSRIVCATATLLFSISVLAFTPRTGHWYNPAENGTGYNIDIQDGQMVVTVYSYKTNGDSEWYIATGPMTGGQSSFVGTLGKIRNGPCISCAYVPANAAGNDGTITITFQSETSATVFKPGGRVSNIQPLNFGFGDPPTALLGEWVFVEVIGGAYFADHYKYTQVIAGTSTGNGIAADFANYASCEYQTSGSFIGYVLCFHWSSSSYTTVVDQYQFKLGLDQTFSGTWVSPTTLNSFPMKGNIWVSRSGYPKALGAGIDDQAESDRKHQAELSAARQMPKAMAVDIDPTALERIKEEMRNALVGAR